MVKQKLDIGIFSSMYSQVNGTANAVRFLSESLAKTGHNVHIFAPKIQNSYKIPSLHFNDLGGVRTKKSDLVLSFPILKGMIWSRSHDYLDIGHIHTHATVGAMGVGVCKYMGIPMIGTHNSPLQYYSAQYVPIFGKLLTKTKFLWWYERTLLSKYDLTQVATESKKKLLRCYRFKEPIITLTNGINDYFYQDVKENDIRERYNLGDKKILLYVSRLAPEKHPVSVIKIFKKIHKRVPHSHLILVGGLGPTRIPVKKIIKKLKMEDDVTYMGFVPFSDLLRLYIIADLTCIWSFVEAEGLVLIEAMAQGTPSVGTNACGIKDVIRHGKTGYLANDLDELENYIVKLLKDDDLREEFGKNAKRIAENYRVSKIAKIWIKIYKFTINELYPLRYNNRDRRDRVELVKEFVHKFSDIGF